MVDARYTTRPPKAEAPVDDGAWFREKRFGFGAGWPIRWQGWALLASYLAVVGGAATLDRGASGSSRGVGLGIIIAATIAFVQIAARHTRGGWKWRWGGKN